ncbi:polyphosphate polymerase domain-containing protein [Oceanirhabdus sp. W0125-5]|uniref:polyphosphate polymerase domain-containing protein n=1 Tax=Oceanirhabdus sp. W0125-5 TaxID=2999116 RepID=UPI0022F2E15F|nr:polyphosphate polymerase domain-containing protein [Oceanirhabdus sp. W0125-5]WBW99074.1 polyphosphate polymerase domain-containing protein [Oceanirhabdus sp. W0125-5]
MEGQKFRHEYKYHINTMDYISLKNKLNKFMSLDNNAINGCDYNIKSLYFDDFKNTALFEKILGVKDRYKFRIRIYNNKSDLIKLEKKIKHGHLVAKQWTSVTKEECENILARDYSFINNNSHPVLKDFYSHIKAFNLEPKVIVDYDREAYTYKAGNVRITFDKRLKTGVNDLGLLNPEVPLITALENNIIVMELKYDEYLPSHIRDILSIGNREALSNSKYVICRKYTKTNMWEEN